MSGPAPSRQDWRPRAQALRSLPLPAVLERSGARPDPRDPHKWHTPVGVLSVNGAKFINWHRGQGGGGAIDLVMHLHGLAFGPALEWLERHVAPGPRAAAAPPSAPPPPLTLPPPAPAHRQRVRAYLTAQRQLPAALLEPLLAAGSLYADAHANAVFVLRAPTDDRPVGAELRGTTAQAWRGMAPGSRKDRGYFAVAAPDHQATVLCESAIDALSCHTLYPHYRCLSTAGARPHPAWLPELLAQDHPVYCGFDRDPTGEAMARAMIAVHPSIRRLRPTRKDWNDVLRWGP